MALKEAVFPTLPDSQHLQLPDAIYSLVFPGPTEAILPPGKDHPCLSVLHSGWYLLRLHPLSLTKTSETLYYKIKKDESKTFHVLHPSGPIRT